jgi:hypothetical protein
MSCGGLAPSTLGDTFELLMTTTDNSQDAEDFEIIAVPSNRQFDITNGDSLVSSNNNPDWVVNYTASRDRRTIKFKFTPRSDQVPFTLYTRAPRTAFAYETMAFQINRIVDTGEDLDEDGSSDLEITEGEIIRYDLREGVAQIRNGFIDMQSSIY